MIGQWLFEEVERFYGQHSDLNGNFGAQFQNVLDTHACQLYRPVDAPVGNPRIQLDCML